MSQTAGRALQYKQLGPTEGGIVLFPNALCNNPPAQGRKPSKRVRCPAGLQCVAISLAWAEFHSCTSQTSNLLMSSLPQAHGRLPQSLEKKPALCERLITLPPGDASATTLTNLRFLMI